MVHPLILEKNDHDLEISIEKVSCYIGDSYEILIFYAAFSLKILNVFYWKENLVVNNSRIKCSCYVFQVMMVSSSLVRPKKPSTSKEDYLHHPYQQYSNHFEIFSVTRSSSASSSASVSRDDSTHSVPSLYQAVGPAMSASASRSNLHDSRLAFTTEDLQIAPKCSANSRGSGLCDSSAGGGSIIVHHHPIIPSPTPGSMKPNKKRFVRHGLMVPHSSDLSDHGTEPSDIQKNSFSSSTPSSIPLRARPTVTTILRQQHVLEKAEQKERAKLEALMVSNAAVLEVDNLTKEQEKKEQEVAKAAEAKRLLQSRLSYEKAIAASRKMANEKQRIAESTRQKVSTY